MSKEYEDWSHFRQLARERTPSAGFASYNFMFTVVLFGANIDSNSDATLTFESLLAQKYRNIEVIVVGKFADPAEWVQRFQHLRGLFYEPDLSPSDFWNEGPSNSFWRGDYLLFAAAGTEFDSDSFMLINATLANTDGRIDLAVIDHDRRAQVGVSREPVFMPGWDPDLELELDYVGTAFVLSRHLVAARRMAGPVENIYDGLKSISRMHPQPSVVHISEPLIHLLSAMPSLGAAAQLIHNTGTSAPRKRQLLTVVIPNRNRPDLLARSLGFLNFDNQFDVDLIIVDNKSNDPETLAIYADIERRHAARILRADHDFNYARMVNLGVWAAYGEIVMLMNNDVEFSKPGQIEQLVHHALRPEIGVVGTHLLYPNGRIQHAGMVFSTDSLGRYYRPHHVLRGGSKNEYDYLFIKNTIRNYEAVTGAVHVVRREFFMSVGGYDEVHLPVEYNDVDFCLRARNRGLRVICLPLESVFHAESESRRHSEKAAVTNMRDDALGIMDARWPRIVSQDQFVNPWVELGDCEEPRFPWQVGGSGEKML